MKTTDHNNKTSSPTSVKPFFFATLLTGVLVLLYLSLKDVSLIREPQAMSAVFSAAFSVRHAHESVDTVSEALFTRTCQRGDLHRMDRFSPSNPSSIAPVSEKVTCPRVIRAANVSLPLTALLSFPGAGNTWVRHLLQQLTGIGTGAVYNDAVLRKNGFPFEGQVDKVIAVKTHNFGMWREIPLNEFSRVIHIVRNVYESMMAEKIRVLTKNHTANAYIITNTTDWRISLLDALNRWDIHMRRAFSYKGPMLIVFYDDLKSQLLVELKRMADFLACDHLKEFSFCCALKEKNGDFRRKPHSQAIAQIYRRDARILVNRYLEGMAMFLNQTHPAVSAKFLSYRMPVSF